MRSEFGPAPEGTADIGTLTARRVYELRRWRDANTPHQYFGEPAWDMLLELWIAREEGRSLPATGLAAGIVSDAVRQDLLSRLEADGIIFRVKHAHNAEHYELDVAGINLLGRIFWTGLLCQR